MDKIKIKLNNSEWIMLAAIVLRASVDQNENKEEDKYTRVMMHELMRQIYAKLHNRMHSLKSKKVNGLSLTLPEAAAFNTAFAFGEAFLHPLALAIVTEVVGIIDQKLT